MRGVRSISRSHMHASNEHSPKTPASAPPDELTTPNDSPLSRESFPSRDKERACSENRITPDKAHTLDEARPVNPLSGPVTQAERPITKGGILSRLVDWYLTPRDWEQGGKIYDYVGIQLFRKILPTSGKFIFFPSSLNKAMAILRSPGEDQSREGQLARYAEGRKFIECIHLLGAGVLAGASLFAAAIGNPEGALKLMALNLYLNIYPTILQRHQRLRTSSVLERLKNRKDSQGSESPTTD
jgi:hypothetical protein